MYSVNSHGDTEHPRVYILSFPIQEKSQPKRSCPRPQAAKRSTFLCNSSCRPSLHPMTIVRRSLFRHLPLAIHRPNSCSRSPRVTDQTSDPLPLSPATKHPNDPRWNSSYIYSYSENHTIGLIPREDKRFNSKDNTTANGPSSLSSEYCCVFMNSFEPKIGRSWGSLDREDLLEDGEFVFSVKEAKRWSFCYGEDGNFDNLTRTVHDHDFLRKTCLWQSYRKWNLSNCENQGDLCVNPPSTKV